MKALIGSHIVYKHPSGHDKRYRAYRIVDYVGHEHVIMEETGWASSSADHREHIVIHPDSEPASKPSIVGLDTLMKDFLDGKIRFCFHRHEIRDQLTKLSKKHSRIHENEAYDEWIQSLTREITETA